MKAFCNFAVTPVWAQRSVVRIIFLIASAEEHPCPMTLGARSMDGIKRRVRQGMGRCQAGFCTPRAMEILSRETGIPITEICKNRKGSEMIKGEEA